MTSSVRHVCRLRGCDGAIVGVAASIDKCVAVTNSSVVSWVSSPSGEGVSYVKHVVGAAEGVSGVVMSSKGHATTCSSDGSLCVWGTDKKNSSKMLLGGDSKCAKTCIGLTHNGMTVSGGADGSLTVRDERGRIVKGGRMAAFKDRVCSVHCSPSGDKPVFAATCVDGTTKVYTLDGMKRLSTLASPTKKITTSTRPVSVIVSPDGILAAVGHKNGEIGLWEAETGAHLYTFSAANPITQICFSPTRYWLCAATSRGVEVMDLETKISVNVSRSKAAVGRDNNEDVEEASSPGDSCSPATSLCWSEDGCTLFAGYADGDIHVFDVVLDEQAEVLAGKWGTDGSCDNAVCGDGDVEWS